LTVQQLLDQLNVDYHKIPNNLPEMLSLYRLIKIVGNALKAPDQEINIAPGVLIRRCPFTKDGYWSEDDKQPTKDLYKEERATKQLRNKTAVNMANIENAILDSDVEACFVDRLQDKELPADNLGKRTYEDFCETTASANG